MLLVVGDMAGWAVPGSTQSAEVLQGCVPVQGIEGCMFVVTVSGTTPVAPS